MDWDVGVEGVQRFLMVLDPNGMPFEIRLENMTIQNLKLASKIWVLSNTKVNMQLWAFVVFFSL